MKTLLIATAIAVSGWGFAPGAQAQSSAIVNSVNSDDLVSYVEDAGHTVNEIAQTEEPLLRVTSDEGLIYYVQGNACTDGQCQGIKFLARYDAAPSVTLDRVNELNMQVPAIKLWYNENTLGMERYLILNDGILEANILYEIDTFITIAPRIAEMFGAE